MAFDYKKAMLFDRLEDNNIRCRLCNFKCKITPDNNGKCRVRRNIDGQLYSLNYHKICAAGADPIEKKPLFHFLPGSKSFSVAAVGCNFTCSFCQNWQISQAQSPEDIYGRKIAPEKIVALARQNHCASIAYTYTEPTIFFELANDTAKLAQAESISNVFVSNGYMSKEAIDTAADWLDAINIDLKAFTEDYYRTLCGARLGPVLETIKHIAKNTDIWMEITTLLVPGENDSDDELKQMAQFLYEAIGPDAVWHLSRFYPQYQYDNSAPTPISTLQRAYDIAKQQGINHVYIGNLTSAKAECTYCPDCGQMVIQREGFYLLDVHLSKGKCSGCGREIAGRFE